MAHVVTATCRGWRSRAHHNAEEEQHRIQVQKVRDDLSMDWTIGADAVSNHRPDEEGESKGAPAHEDDAGKSQALRELQGCPPHRILEPLRTSDVASTVVVAATRGVNRSVRLARWHTIQRPSWCKLTPRWGSSLSRAPVGTLVRSRLPPATSELLSENAGRDGGIRARVLGEA